MSIQIIYLYADCYLVSGIDLPFWTIKLNQPNRTKPNKQTNKQIVCPCSIKFLLHTALLLFIVWIKKIIIKSLRPNVYLSNGFGYQIGYLLLVRVLDYVRNKTTNVYLSKWESLRVCVWLFICVCFGIWLPVKSIQTVIFFNRKLFSIFTFQNIPTVH